MSKFVSMLILAVFTSLIAAPCVQAFVPGPDGFEHITVITGYNEMYLLGGQGSDAMFLADQAFQESMRIASGNSQDIKVIRADAVRDRIQEMSVYGALTQADLGVFYSGVVSTGCYRLVELVFDDKNRMRDKKTSFVRELSSSCGSRGSTSINLPSDPYYSSNRGYNGYIPATPRYCPPPVIAYRSRRPTIVDKFFHKVETQIFGSNHGRQQVQRPQSGNHRR